MKENPLMNKGEEYVIFAEKAGKNSYFTLTATQGRFWYDQKEKTVSSMEYVKEQVKGFCNVDIKQMKWKDFKEEVLKELPIEKKLPKVAMRASWKNRYETVSALKNASSLIAIIKVDKKSYYRNDTTPMTKFTVKIKKAAKGCKKNEEKQFIMTGGIYNEHYYEIEDAPLMEEGKEYLVFAKENSDGTYSLLSGAQGRMFFDREAKQISLTNIEKNGIWRISSIRV